MGLNKELLSVFLSVLWILY